MPLMEGTDSKLSEPYKKRSDPVNTCSRVAQDRGYKGMSIMRALPYFLSWIRKISEPYRGENQRESNILTRAKYKLFDIFIN